MNHRRSRRQFIKNSATWVGASLASRYLTACSHLDRWLVGGGTDARDRVVILGAGAAGLVAAYELKKAQVPFQVFEGSERIGGRVLSLRDFNRAQQSVELGAEWISQDHQAVWKISKELKLEIVQTAPSEKAPPFFFAGVRVDEAKMVAELRRLQSLLVAWTPRRTPQGWDHTTLEELLDLLKSEVSPATLMLLRRTANWEWGADPQSVSALYWFRRMASGADGPSRWLNEDRFRLAGGTGILIRALYDRVAGVVPDRYVAFSHQLLAIRDRGAYLDLQFQSPSGTFELKCKVVICTLPFSVLRDVEGLDKLELLPARKKLIREMKYGTHAKLAVGYPDRFWQTRFGHQRWSGDFESQWIWQSAPEGNPLQTRAGILTAQLAGQVGREAGLQSLEQLRKDLQHLGFQNLPTEENSHVQNWSQMPWAKGSVSYLGPGQVLSSSEALQPSDYEGTFLYAGEHISLRYPGTLNGAFSTGMQAAEAAIQLRGQLAKPG